MPVTFKPKQKNWNCPKKQWARKETILDAYADIFGQKQLPPDKQYWTLCGECGSEEGMLEGCELHQITEAGFIQPDQFYGVELDNGIHDFNFMVRGGYHWIHGDFGTMMEDYAARDKFNPAIVNYDSIHFPTTDAEYFVRVLKLIADLRIQDVLVIGNFVMKSHHRPRIANQVIVDALINTARGKELWASRWFTMEGRCFAYPGTGKDSRATMVSVLFWNRS